MVGTRQRAITSQPRAVATAITAVCCLCLSAGSQADTQKPVLHGKYWVAITGKPLAATAGARTFLRGGNAVDAACAMLAATSTMWDVLGWGGETQALIYNPHTKEVLGINALGVAPTGATPDFFREQGLDYPPEFGPLAAVTPGTPGGLMVMLAEYGSLSLAEVLAPAIEMADGYPIEESAVRAIERHRDRILEWPYSTAVFLPHEDDGPRGPAVGEVFRQPDLKAPSAPRLPTVSTAKRPSTRLTSASIVATLPRRSCALCASTAGCSRWKTSTAGRYASRNR
jgi:gamma-glutamyltranspeptidase/glutathione hydrolase